MARERNARAILTSKTILQIDRCKKLNKSSLESIENCCLSADERRFEEQQRIAYRGPNYAKLLEIVWLYQQNNDLETFGYPGFRSSRICADLQDFSAGFCKDRCTES